MNTISLDEIKQLDNNLKANDWGVKPTLEIEDPNELLKLFQLFYYFNGRLPLTNDLLPIPDQKTPDGSEKISIKILYKIMNKHKKKPTDMFNKQDVTFTSYIKILKD